DGPIPGLRARYLVRDMDDRDCGHSITVWESLEAMRAYEASDLFKKVIEPALQPFFANEFKTSVSEIALQDDLAACVPAAVIAARFHAGLVAALARMVDELRASGSRSVCGPTDTRC